MVTGVINPGLVHGGVAVHGTLAPAVPVPPELQVELCPGDQPLLLLPVRLETRFFAQTDGSFELRVRIYPDKVHLDAHETELLPAERDWAQHYWTQVWRAGGNAQREADAWRQLADRYGAERAAWLRRLARPLNDTARPTAPADADAPPTPAPRFPDIAVVDDGRDASWRRAPLAMALPERWTAVACRGDQVLAFAIGRDIGEPLAVGPAPQALSAERDLQDDAPALDPGMQWMIDFDAAERIGMALRLRIENRDAESGIETLLVFGARASQSPADAARQLAQLFDAHQYTDGLEFLRIGVPTNNTAEMRAGYGGNDIGHEHSRAALDAAPTAAADATSNARTLARALGIEAAVDGLAAAAGAPQSHPTDQRDMNTALWAASWGYYLGNMIGFNGTGLSIEGLAWARRHFIDHVHAFGALPALRCGRQPYGVLPVTLLGEWQPEPGHEALQAADLWLRDLLLKLRQNIWRAQLKDVPRVGRSGDPAVDLSEVMRTDALSSGYAVRPLLGRHYFEHLRAFMGENLRGNGFIDTQRALAVGLLQRLDLPWRPRLFEAVYGDLAWRISGDLLQAGEVSPWRALEPNYIAALLAAPRIADIAGMPVASGASPSLLHALLRHAMLLEYVNAAALLLAGQGGDFATLVRDAELIDLLPGARTPTWHSLLDQKVAALSGERTLREFLETLTRFDGPALAPLGEFRASLARLQTLDSERLLLLMQGSLDLASHRLDAWASSFAVKRLAAMRQQQPTGLRLGGYGWVHDLKPARPSAPVPTLPPGEDGPLFALSGDTGFIHAPSLAHAATAALLRNAHLGHNGVADADEPFAIDLSSQRLRDAKWLLDGVRQGQPLGALLGYRFERRLHELHRDELIAGFRERAPLVAGRLEATTLPLESIAANNVVDGLRLWELWNSNRPGIPADAAVARELDALGETIDALSDALTAESAYQLVRGNISRSAGTLAAVAGGDMPAPELEVARTPRSGIGLTHRIVVAFSGKASRTPGWATAAASPRAAAEPLLNAWAARLLGDPRKIVCRIEQLDDDGEQLQHTHDLPLSALKLAPLDVVYAVEAEARAGAASELELMLLQHLRANVDTLTPQTRLRISLAREPAAKAASLADVLVQAGAARRLLTAARALEAGDLDLPEHGIGAGLDLAELQARTSKAEKALLAAHKALLPRREPAAAARRKALQKLARFGVRGAIPVPPHGDDDATRSALRAQALALARETRARLEAGAALRAQPELDNEEGQRDRLLERLQAVFGAGFKVLPKFGCAHPEALADALAQSAECQGGDPLNVYTWFDRVERVREGAARLGAALRGAEALGSGATLALSVAQLPQRLEGEAWVGMTPAAGKAIEPGRLSLVVHAGSPLQPAQPMAGLLVDEWVEVVPNREESTALAFQYNPPDTCAPQALLLAVPPVAGRAWTHADLQRLLLDTFEMARLRAVDAEALGELGHYLPALSFGINAEGAAVSTDFRPLTR
jgi:hypothetical protein